ncbi:hypothetical protein [Mesorhizobium sp. IMUNJ 23232]|uniref:hypothetical protein n=1 Tax=Mesorhizobium sp. IMUNJ 23232 TaxID=3376064 RepID=UPI0037B8F116
MATVANWVYLSNLNVLLDELQNMSGERLDEGLFKILRDDIEGSNTDDTPPRWASADFDGPRLITASLGIDRGTEVLHVRLEVPDELATHAETLFYVMQRYRLVR